MTTAGLAPADGSALGMSYDGDGNLLGQTKWLQETTSYTYNPLDRVVSKTDPLNRTTSYTYNGDGLRTSNTVNGTATAEVWDPAEGMPLLLQDGTMNYLTGPGGLPLEQITTNGEVLYYYQDQLGSTRALLNGSGTTVATFSYFAYGTRKGSTGTTTTPFGFAGQYTDAESGLQYLRNRYYDPSTEQFLTVDPLVSQTQQPYSYANDTPLNMTDPTGLCGNCQGGNPLQVTWDWLQKYAGPIALVVGALAIIAAAILSPELLSSAVAIAGLVAGVIGMYSDFREGKYLAAAFDLIGMVTGWEAFRFLLKAGALATEVKRLIGLAKETEGLHVFVQRAIDNMDKEKYFTSRSARWSWMSGIASAVALVVAHFEPGLKESGQC